MHIHDVNTHMHMHTYHTYMYFIILYSIIIIYIYYNIYTIVCTGFRIGWEDSWKLAMSDGTSGE